MNKEITVRVAGFLVGVGIAAVGLYIPIITEREKRKQIKAETIAETNAMMRAARYVMNGISDGDYDDKPGQIMIDYEFARLMERMD